MIKINNLFKQYNSHGGVVDVLKGINLDVPQGSLFTLLGPSGCGKTTTLRSVAGLEKPTKGEIYLDKTLVYSSDKGILTPPEKREIGMVFQSYAIWPHMTVLENVTYPLEAKRVPGAERRKRAMDMLDKVGLSALAERPAPQLSGGQQQRIALARALVSRPQVLLFDEPLSNLDAKLREQLRFEIVSLQKEFGITALYVTHDQEEALAISDRIAIMQSGAVIEMGEALTLYQKPSCCFTASFLGLANFVPGTIISARDDVAMVSTAIATFACKNPHALSVDQNTLVFFRPESVTLHAPDENNGGNTLAAYVKNRTFLGDKLDIRLQVNDFIIRGKTQPKFIPNIGERIACSVDPEACIAMPFEAEPNTVQH
jgi:iron(III) transport system ATP-binding protein